MGPSSLSKSDKIPPAQVVWQIFEVVMNIWILWAIITVGLSLPLILWTIFEVGMNAWILVTMVKIGVKKITVPKRR